MARSAKIDKRQNIFDFDLLEELASQLENEIDEGEKNVNTQTKNLGTSRKSVEPRNNAGSSPLPEHEPFRLGNSRPLGDEQPREAEAHRTERWNRNGSNTSPNPTEQGNEYFDHQRSNVTDGAGLNATRDFRDAWGEYGTGGDGNYKITEKDNLGIGNAKTKFYDNLEAIKILKNLEANNVSFASEDEKLKLVKYVGWGGLPQAFDEFNTTWNKEHSALKNLLTDDEYNSARKSTLDAHFTSKEVIEGIYSGLERLGFSGEANILEPSAGTGNFLGLLPPNLVTINKLYAVELDSLSASISSYLYPEAKHLNQGFQDVKLPNEYFDLTIGNPPFGNQKIYDADNPELNYSIHNYFLAKSINSLRDNGLAAFVVSRYFLDANNNSARDFIAEKANLLGAIRLPNTAFKENALTEVTTDIVFFQKTTQPELNPNWLNVKTVKDINNNEFNINQYFINNPQQMIGKMLVGKGQYENVPSLLPPKNFQGFKAEIEKRLEILPKNIYQSRTFQKEIKVITEPLENFQALKIGAFFQTNKGELARRLPDELGEAKFEFYEAKNATTQERIFEQIKIRNSVRFLLNAEQSGSLQDFELEIKRKELNVIYDKFIKKYGYLNTSVNKTAMKDDPEGALLLSLEREFDPGTSKAVAKKNGLIFKEASASKADIFKKRVLGIIKKITKVETAKEALLVSINEYGQVNLEFMEKLYGKNKDEIIDELGNLIYFNPQIEKWELAEYYLSGNVKEKLKIAKEFAENNNLYTKNIIALEEIQPLDIEPIDISLQMNSAWLPPQTLKDFAKHILGKKIDMEIDYLPSLGKWNIKIVDYTIDNTLNYNTWGSERYSANRIFTSILNNTPIKVTDKVFNSELNKEISVTNEKETAIASQKAEAMKEAFQNWVWVDQNRREKLCNIYNERFNTHIPTKYDGSHLDLPSSSLAINLRPHQKDAIWRGIQEGTALFDHVVGAGKTLVCVATAVESKRMGLLQKPMIVAPNHLLKQWQDSFYSLYPGANILVAEKSDFKKENREKLFASIATNNWDAVIVAHSSFKSIGLPKETLKDILTEQVEDLTQAIFLAKSENNQGFSIKQMERTKERLIASLEMRNAKTGEKDTAVTFEDLGVDALFVDESQEFKNLFINTSLRNVAGLGNLQGSAKAFDLYVKCRYLQNKHNGKGVYFATGTPISNTIAEMFTIQRYLQYNDVKEKGLQHFDAWASTFGDVVTGWELDATGVNYKLNSRFSKFQNMPELINMYRCFADVITKHDLEQQEETKNIIPKIKGDKPLNIIAERSPLQANYMGIQTQVCDNISGQPLFYIDGTPIIEWTENSIIHRMENLPDDSRIDNPLKITNDARKAGLDYRLIDPMVEDFPESKINVAIDNIYRIYKKWEVDKGTQLVFCDLSTPKLLRGRSNLLSSSNSDEEKEISNDEILALTSSFSVYEDVKEKLIKKGVPIEEIKFIHDANTDNQKAKLFHDVNNGNVRILIGSTSKMGAGTNVQQRLTALHHLDAPWRPSDLEQREGRILRQGNLLFQNNPKEFEVEIIRYATKQTYDARMWQTIESKAQGIEQFRKGDNLTRTIEDITSEAANSAEMKAAATGNELMFTQVKLSAELKKLEAVYSNFQRSKHKLDNKVSSLSQLPEKLNQEKLSLQKAVDLRDKNTFKNDDFYFIANGKIFNQNNKKELLKHIGQGIMKSKSSYNIEIELGIYKGFEINVSTSLKNMQFSLTGAGNNFSPANLNYPLEGDFSLSGFINRTDNFLNKFEEFIKQKDERITESIEEFKIAKGEQNKVFPQMKLLEVLRQDNREVITELKLSQNPNYKTNWKPKSLNLETKKTEISLVQ